MEGMTSEKERKGMASVYEGSDKRHALLICEGSWAQAVCVVLQPVYYSRVTTCKPGKRFACLILKGWHCAG